MTFLPRRLAMLLIVATLGACTPARIATATPPAPLGQQVRAMLDSPDLAGTRWGVLVVDDQGREIVAIDPDRRFVPASNSKIPAVLANLASSLPEPMGTAVAIDGGDAVLIGAGDPWLSAAPDCTRDCLSSLADAVAARTRTVRDVIGDDSLWRDERWGQGWSWNNLTTRSGTAISALSLDENVVTLTVTGGGVGAPAAVRASDDWYEIDNRVTTASATALSVSRLPSERRLVVSGTIAASGGTATLVQAVDDPAHWAAHRFAAMLRARGVRVTGRIWARHRQPGAAAPSSLVPLARLDPPALDETLARTMKASQNLFAEMLLRRAGDGSAEGGLARYPALFAAAGAPRTGWDFADGSGMSNYNRLSPRASVALLQWAAGQPWGGRWQSTLAVGGVDGTLARRFRGTALERRVRGKTGSLAGASALSGYVTAASGRTLTFAIFANDMPFAAASVTPAMDRALLAIAAAN